MRIAQLMSSQRVSRVLLELVFAITSGFTPHYCYHQACVMGLDEFHIPDFRNKVLAANRPRLRQMLECYDGYVLSE